MLPRINNKSLLECSESDLQIMIHNPDYRENQYLDYKKSFSFIEMQKRGCSIEQVDAKVAEFRNDICAFANSEGGYLVYGIKEDQAMVAELTGIEINNPDQFELDLRNKMVLIMPKAPPIQIRLIPLLSGKYIVILYIEHDFYAPYIHLENKTNYKVYKRYGNRNLVIGYTELKNMFIQSRALENEIIKFRHERIRFHSGTDEEKHLVFHIIPESFMYEKKPLIIIEKKEGKYFRAVFSNTRANAISVPCVDGIRCHDDRGNERGTIFNNGIIEYVLPLKIYLEKLFDLDGVWYNIDNVLQSYQQIMPQVFGNQRYFACISMVGVQDVITEENIYGKATKTDRDLIFCEPTVFSNIMDKNEFYQDMKKLHLEYLLSLGVRQNKVPELIKEIGIDL